MDVKHLYFSIDQVNMQKQAPEAFHFRLKTTAKSSDGHFLGLGGNKNIIKANHRIMKRQ